MTAADRVVSNLVRQRARSQRQLFACPTARKPRRPLRSRQLQASKRVMHPLAPAELPEIDALVSAAIAEHELPGAAVAIARRSGIVFLCLPRAQSCPSANR
jgi:hypothetical protein